MFVILWVLCLLLLGDCVCYFEGVVCYCVVVVFVIVWWLCLLFCGCCVCYCQLIFFFVSLFRCNKVFSNRFGEVCVCIFIRCCLYQFEIGASDKGLLDLSVSHIIYPSFRNFRIVFEVH